MKKRSTETGEALVACISSAVVFSTSPKAQVYTIALFRLSFLFLQVLDIFDGG